MRGCSHVSTYLHYLFYDDTFLLFKMLQLDYLKFLACFLCILHKKQARGVCSLNACIHGMKSVRWP